MKFWFFLVVVHFVLFLSLFFAFFSFFLSFFYSFIKSEEKKKSKKYKNIYKNSLLHTHSKIQFDEKKKRKRNSVKEVLFLKLRTFLFFFVWFSKPSSFVIVIITIKFTIVAYQLNWNVFFKSLCCCFFFILCLFCH